MRAPSHSAAAPHIDEGAWRWWSVLVVLGLLVAMFAAVATLGAHQAARGERVLGVLDPLVDLLRGDGCNASRWMAAHADHVGWAITATLGTLAALGLMIGGWSSWPLGLLATAVLLATWGQARLLAGQLPEGVSLYAAGVAAAVALGIRCPLRRLPGIPPRSAEDARDAAVPRRFAHWRWEAGLVLTLALVGLLLRMYALTELPGNFDDEMIASMVMSYSLWGVGAYFRSSFFGVSAGIVHVLVGPLFFGFFGSSLYTIRIVAVFFGFVAIPLVYWLARRLVGIGGAVIATVLLIVAPEHLYWSRLEVGGFAPVAVFAFITVHLGLWLVRRFSFGALLATALWMPVSRYLYAVCWLMCLYPAALFLHSALFIKRVWRTTWYVVPLLSAGVGLWTISLSVATWLTSGKPWRFIHPVMVLGAPAWRRLSDPALAAAPFPELVSLQVRGMASQLLTVFNGLWVHDPGILSKGFTRACLAADQQTEVTAPVAVLFALGVGYLLGQAHTRRAAAILGWVAIGLVPAIMSGDALTRRQAVMLAAVPVVAGLFLRAVVAISRAVAGQGLARATTVLIGVALAGIAGTSLASHFAVRTAVPAMVQSIAFARPVFERGDILVHDLDPRRLHTLLFGNLDTFFAAPSCIEEILPGRGLRSVLRPACNFQSGLYEMTIPQERRRAVRDEYAPQRMSFLTRDTEKSRSLLALLDALYPRTARKQYQSGASSGGDLLGVTVEMAEVRTLWKPSLVVGAGVDASEGLETRVLKGVTLSASKSENPAANEDAAMIVRGGLLLERGGWYNFVVRGVCPQAVLTVGDNPFPMTNRHPMLEGIHAFEVRIPNLANCALPLELLMTSDAPGTTHPIDPAALFSPHLASIPLLRPAAVRSFPGYGDARELGKWSSGTGVDMAVDGHGVVSVLLSEKRNLRVQRFDRNGNDAGSWDPQVRGGQPIYRLEVDAEGTMILLAGFDVVSRDPEGRRRMWSLSKNTMWTDIAATPDHHLLVTAPDRNAIAVFTFDGSPQGEIRHFAGGPQEFVEPVSVITAPGGEMLVIQSDGLGLLFQPGENVLAPRFVRTFQVLADTGLTRSLGASFDGPQRLLVLARSPKIPFVYNDRGERLLATAPEQDLAGPHIGQVVRYRAAGDRVHALTDRRVWVFRRN